MNIKLIMMLKNEDDLAYPWIRYHGALVGYENLILLDNGSTSPRTISALEWGRQHGARLNSSLASPQDFIARGDLYVGLIKHMDQHGVADFWFPMDCDEFLTVGDLDGVDCSRQALEDELAPHVGSLNPLLISAALNNHPSRAGYFRWSTQRKTFFAANACDYLDHGFHYGRTRQNLDGVQTRVVYIHYHYKPYPLLIEHAKAKLAPYTEDFSHEGLLAYGLAQKPAFHCVHHLLTSEHTYYDSFAEAEYVEFPAFTAALARVGERLPFLEAGVPNNESDAHTTSIPLDIAVTRDNFDDQDYLLANQDVAQAVASGAIPSGYWHFNRYGYAEGRRMRRVSLIEPLRRQKIAKIEPILRTDMTFNRKGLKYDFLTADLARQTGIQETAAVSSNGYDSFGDALIAEYADGLVLDCGAGKRPIYFHNVINYEIVDYDTTDVLGVGEVLPFIDNSIDAVISVAVLEHVRDPFVCAAEIVRVLKPGGKLLCCVPFLQPEHAYPHHYFNMAPQGLRSLFERSLTIDDHKVIGSILPVWALRWMVQSWAEGLQGPAREEFGALTMDALLATVPAELLDKTWVKELPERKNFELACATLLFAHKPLVPPLTAA